MELPIASNIRCIRALQASKLLLKCFECLVLNSTLKWITLLYICIFVLVHFSSRSHLIDHMLFACTLTGRVCSWMCWVFFVIFFDLFVFGSIQRWLSYGNGLNDTKTKQRKKKQIFTSQLTQRQLANKYSFFSSTIMPYSIHAFWVVVVIVAVCFL